MQRYLAGRDCSLCRGMRGGYADLLVGGEHGAHWEDYPRCLGTGANPAPEVTHQMIWAALDSIARYGEGELPPMGDLIGGPENKNHVAMRAALVAALAVMPATKGVEDDHA